MWIDLFIPTDSLRGGYNVTGHRHLLPSNVSLSCLYPISEIGAIYILVASAVKDIFDVEILSANYIY